MKVGGEFWSSDATSIYKKKNRGKEYYNGILAEEWYGRITEYAGNLFIIKDFNMHVLEWWNADQLMVSFILVQFYIIWVELTGINRVKVSKKEFIICPPRQTFSE